MKEGIQLTSTILINKQTIHCGQQCTESTAHFNLVK
jgi:hypothetical protein